MKTFLIFIGLKLAELVGLTIIYFSAKILGTSVIIETTNTSLMKLGLVEHWFFFPLFGACILTIFVLTCIVIGIAIKWNWEKAKDIANRTKTYHV